jgi:hypothetical protein
MFKEIGGHVFRIDDISHVGPLLEGSCGGAMNGTTFYEASWWEFEVEIPTNYGSKTIRPSFKTEEEAKSNRDALIKENILR